MTVSEQVTGTMEIRLGTTGALWMADVEAQGSDHLRVCLRPGELGTLPALQSGNSLDCAMEDETGRFCVAAEVIKQQGALLWIAVSPIWKRRDRRDMSRMPGTFAVAYTAGELQGIGACLNISSGGMLLRTAQPLPLRSMVEMAFVLPGELQTLKTQALVLHVAPTENGFGLELGLKFVRLSVLDSLQISRFCQI